MLGNAHILALYCIQHMLVSFDYDLAPLASTTGQLMYTNNCDIQEWRKGYVKNMMVVQNSRRVNRLKLKAI